MKGVKTMKQETILQSLKRIEDVIYSVPYDNLTIYLQGVKDIINLVNGEEDNISIANCIIEHINNLTDEIPF